MAVLGGGDIIGARLDGGFHHLVFGGDFRVEFDHADTVEHEGHRPRFGQSAARFREIGADFRCRAVAVIGQRLDDDSNATGRIPFIADFLVILGVATRRLLDRALNIILRHVFRTRRLNGGAQARIHGRIGQAKFGGNQYFACKFREHLGAHRILLAFAMHDVLEL